MTGEIFETKPTKQADKTGLTGYAESALSSFADVLEGETDTRPSERYQSGLTGIVESSLSSFANILEGSTETQTKTKPLITETPTPELSVVEEVKVEEQEIAEATEATEASEASPET